MKRIELRIGGKHPGDESRERKLEGSIVESEYLFERPGDEEHWGRGAEEQRSRKAEKGLLCSSAPRLLTQVAHTFCVYIAFTRSETMHWKPDIINTSLISTFS